uniref:Uncharacterized protein n=1 Tax=Acrobeloides nanus TaxID=290746 RepID=A0A914CQR2_9BILA
MAGIMVEEKLPNGTRLCCFSEGKYESIDVLKDEKERSENFWFYMKIGSLIGVGGFIIWKKTDHFKTL